MTQLGGFWTYVNKFNCTNYPVRLKLSVSRESKKNCNLVFRALPESFSFWGKHSETWDVYFGYLFPSLKIPFCFCRISYKSTERSLNWHGQFRFKHRYPARSLYPKRFSVSSVAGRSRKCDVTAVPSAKLSTKKIYCIACTMYKCEMGTDGYISDTPLNMSPRIFTYSLIQLLFFFHNKKKLQNFRTEILNL